MQLDPVVLENRFVRLEPLGEAHRADLRAACQADPDTWRDLYPYSMLDAAFDETWDRLMQAQAAGSLVDYAVVVDGRCVGKTGYQRPDAANAVVEIGGTYYGPEHRGGPTNPACKRLMLGSAFDRGARRVAFRVDAINARSRAAVTKLGAHQDGILRQDLVTWTGRIRDTVIFSVLDSEWPEIRERLDARLAAFA
jgi:RimJ/RimL family protein N-acetyltransferase